MAKLHQAANTEISAFVTNYLPRPVLRIRQSAVKVDSFSYVEAIRRFGHYLTPEFLAEESKYAKPNVGLENLRPMFLVLSADLIQSGNIPSPANQASTQARGGGTGRGRGSGAKRGSEHLAQGHSGPAKRGTGRGNGRGSSRGGGGGRGGRGRGGVSFAGDNRFATLATIASSPDTERSFVSQQAETNSEQMETNQNPDDNEERLTEEELSPDNDFDE